MSFRINAPSPRMRISPCEFDDALTVTVDLLTVEEKSIERIEEK